MSGFERYAIYYAPPSGSELWRWGSAWLGWDAEARAPAEQPQVEGLPGALSEMTAFSRRYGFHGTLKPPFALAEGRAADELIAAAAALAARTAPFEAPALRLSAATRFASLRLSAPSPEMSALAAACVTELDGFRAPPSEGELARRRKAGLTEAQEANLTRWGYPYVLEAFSFHLTLAGPLEAEALARVAEALAPRVAPLCRAPLPVTEIAVYGDPGGGAPFALIERLPFAGRAAA
ncbi:MAG: DUF1045 domain-containing protein [Pseudomonadota bacterium]